MARTVPVVRHMPPQSFVTGRIQGLSCHDVSPLSRRFCFLASIAVERKQIKWRSSAPLDQQRFFCRQKQMR